MIRVTLEFKTPAEAIAALEGLYGPRAPKKFYGKSPLEDARKLDGVLAHIDAPEKTDEKKRVKVTRKDGSVYYRAPRSCFRKPLLMSREQAKKAMTPLPPDPIRDANIAGIRKAIEQHQSRGTSPMRYVKEKKKPVSPTSNSKDQRAMCEAGCGKRLSHGCDICPVCSSKVCGPCFDREADSCVKCSAAA